MSKRSGLRPPRQSYAQIPQGAVALDDVQKQRNMQEAQLRQRIEAVALTLYSRSVDVREPEAKQAQLCQSCFDSALVFAREAWGVQGHRVRAPKVEPVAPPRPVQSSESLHPDIIPLFTPSGVRSATPATNSQHQNTIDTVGQIVT